MINPISSYDPCPPLPEKWRSVANVSPNPFPVGKQGRCSCLRAYLFVRNANSILYHDPCASLLEKWRSVASVTTIPIHALRPALHEKWRSVANVIHSQCPRRNWEGGHNFPIPIKGLGNTPALPRKSRREAMATFPPSFWTYYENDHDHTPPFLTRIEAETMASFTPSF